MGYYVVKSDDLNKKIQETFDQHAAEQKVLYKFIKTKFKTEKFYQDQKGRVLAMLFKGNPDPKVWKASKHYKDGYTIKMTSKVNRELYSQFSALNKELKLSEIVKAIGYGEGTKGCFMGTNVISFHPGIVKGNDGKYYLSTPEWVDGRWDHDKDSIQEITSENYRKGTIKIQTLQPVQEQSSLDNV